MPITVHCSAVMHYYACYRASGETRSLRLDQNSDIKDMHSGAGDWSNRVALEVQWKASRPQSSSLRTVMWHKVSKFDSTKSDAELPSHSYGWAAKAAVTGFQMSS